MCKAARKHSNSPTGSTIACRNHTANASMFHHSRYSSSEFTRKRRFSLSYAHKPLALTVTVTGTSSKVTAVFRSSFFCKQIQTIISRLLPEPTNLASHELNPMHIHHAPSLLHLLPLHSIQVMITTLIDFNNLPRITPHTLLTNHFYPS